MLSFPDVAPPDTERTRHKRKRDALTESSPSPQLEGIHETRSQKQGDTRKSKKIKLSPRGLEILGVLSGKQLNISDIEFDEEGPRDGGTFADVVAATLIITGRRVAVKKLRFISNMAQEKIFNGFLNETRLVDKLSHPNIVEFTGFVEDMESCICWLVFPWEENGNLHQFLHSGTWELPERVSLIYDVACGLEYLHTQQPPICHGDLKSLNILVNSSHRGVITDFGSARTIEPGATSSPHPAARASAICTPSKGSETAQVKLAIVNNALTLTGPACSVRWAPPEYFEGKPLDLANDIWALGWIGWEAITGRYPFEELGSDAHVLVKIMAGQLPMIYDDDQLSQIRELCGIMERCWKSDPSERLSAIECEKAIRWVPRAIPSTKSGDKSVFRSASLLLEIGEIHLSQGRHEEALTMLEQALEIVRSEGDQITQVELLIRRANILEKKSKYDAAEASLMEALWISETIGNERCQADAMDGLGDVRREKFQYVEAGTYYAKALAIYERIGDDHGRANALKGLGDVRQKQSQHVEAEAYYVEAVDIYKSIGEDIGRANALHGLGDVHKARSRFVEAEAYYLEAVAIYKSIGNDLGQANALKRLGKVYQKQGKYVEAEAYYVEAMAIHKSIGDDLGRANALKRLGNVRQKQSKYVEAEAYYVEAMAIYKNTEDDLGRANALERLGDVHQAQSRYVEAEAYYLEAGALYESIENDLGRANALQRLGDVYQQLSKYIEAEASYAEALSISTRIWDGLGQVNSSLGLAQIRLHQARYAEAKALVGDATSISERIDYEWGMDNSTELLESIRKAEVSYTNLPASFLPPSRNGENSTSPGSLPSVD